jgi:UDP-N-acetylmuramoyl-L-alanyl-D-glutamate--2,6-diaminopimelate ligase
VGVLFGCGGDRDRTKRPKMGRVVAELADYVIITSDNPRTEDPEAIIADILPGLEGLDTPRVVIPDRREAIRWGLEHAQPGDTLVLTGKGHETYQIVGKTKYHMDEREIIAEVLGL